MMPEPAKWITCDRCRREVNPILCRYLWYGFGWRGQRVTPHQGAPREQRGMTLCGPCGNELLETLAARGFPARIVREGLVPRPATYAGARDFFQRAEARA